MIAAGLILTACGGGGGSDAPAKPAEACKEVTNTTGDIVDKAGKVLIAGTSTKVSLCCATAFKVTTTPDQVGSDGSIMKGNTTNSCT
ncbi:hypothetical protein [Paucibacter sp. TC2R-5]|uniref:hypothetical protein n=1 Tax=Paucibacter sp. TC2R-5 TaxID=2893555 RepID=UPI0021E4D6D2|nr:hypothetical protein [Paucibacter sp. TC2R-5]